jgi:plasmid stabilization system protein ParE
MVDVNIYWTNTAVKQRNYILKYWIKHNNSNQYSIKLKLEIEKKTDLLKTNPKLGKTIDFQNTRILVMGHFSIIYQQLKNNIYITGFWDNRQDPAKLLQLIK